jgi:hypothetical protein
MLEVGGSWPCDLCLASPALPAQDAVRIADGEAPKYRHLSDQTPVPLALPSVMWSRGAPQLAPPVGSGTAGVLPGVGVAGSGIRIWDRPLQGSESRWPRLHPTLCRVFCGLCWLQFGTRVRTRPDHDHRPSRASSDSGPFLRYLNAASGGRSREELNTFTPA